MTFYHTYIQPKFARKINKQLLRRVCKECKGQLPNTFKKRYSCGSHSTDPWIWRIIFFYASTIEQSWIAVNNGYRQVLCQWHSGCKNMKPLNIINRIVVLKFQEPKGYKKESNRYMTPFKSSEIKYKNDVMYVSDGSK